MVSGLAACPGSGKKRRWLFIIARNFGDALISRRLVDAVASSFPADELDVLTRPQFRSFFAGRAGIRDVHTAAFPVGTVKKFGMSAAWHLAKLCLRLRRENYDVALNTAGDVRETLLGWLIRPRVNAAPVWPSDHPMSFQIRAYGARGFMHQMLQIPVATLSIYEAHDQMAEQLGCPKEVVARLGQERPVREVVERKLIGLHPFTTQDCKMWNWSAWSALIEQLLSEGLQVRVFCSTKERALAEGNLGAVLAHADVELVEGDVNHFLARLSEVGVVVGLDSFVMHAAYALGVPAVLVNGASDARVWAPPGVRVLSNGGNCPRYPCHCRPTCGDSVVPLYACIRDISPNDVFGKIQAALTEDANLRARQLRR